MMELTFEKQVVLFLFIVVENICIGVAAWNWGFSWGAQKYKETQDIKKEIEQ